MENLTLAAKIIALRPAKFRHAAELLFKEKGRICFARK